MILCVLRFGSLLSGASFQDLWDLTTTLGKGQATLLGVRKGNGIIARFFQAGVANGHRLDHLNWAGLRLKIYIYISLSYWYHPNHTLRLESPGFFSFI